MEFVGFILIGIVAGWLAGRIRTGSGFGLVWNLVIGVVGAILGFEATNLLGKLITATVGALLLLALLRYLMLRKLRGR